MKYISHRGNINGSNPEEENTEVYIHKAILDGYDVEVDIWCIDGELYFGHDEPKEKVRMYYLNSYRHRLWIHTKNVEAFAYFYDSHFNFFCHTDEDYVFTSKGNVWVYPGKPLIVDSIAVAPETCVYTDIDLERCGGICSDYIERYMVG